MQAKITGRSWFGTVAGLIVLLGGCQATAPEPSTSVVPSVAASQLPSPVAPSAAASQLPSPVAPSAVAIQLPSPGGTCTVDQFVVVPGGGSYDAGPLFTRVGAAFLRLRNVGEACLLARPTIIGMTDASNAREAVEVVNAGYWDCSGGACRKVDATSFEVAPNQIGRIALRVQWPWSDDPMNPPPQACDDPLVNVTRVQFPFASGVHEMTLNAPFDQVCPGAGSVEITVGQTFFADCGLGVGYDATLHGSASDPRLAWAINNGSGTRVEILWPAGYGARFRPQLEVLDEHGQIVAHEGDLIIGRCLSDPVDASAIRILATDIRPATWKPGDG